MNVSLDVLGLLRRHDLTTRGAITELSDVLQLSRQGTSRLVNGHVRSISYDHLGAICDWILEKAREKPGLRRALRRELPGALFRFPGLWEELLSADRLILSLGERCAYSGGHTGPATRKTRWVSGADAEVAVDLIQKLRDDGAPFEFEWKIVPFRSPYDPQELDPNLRAEDEKRAQRHYAELANGDEFVKLYVGSQRVNMLVECLVADLGGVDPFRSGDHSERVPFFLRYREPGAAFPESCFGGPERPESIDRDDAPGLYFKSMDLDRWTHLPSLHFRDAGLLIVARRGGGRRVDVALFGCSGAGTRALGRLFVESPGLFVIPMDAGGGYTAFAVEVVFEQNSEAGDSALETGKILSYAVHRVADTEHARRAMA